MASLTNTSSEAMLLKSTSVNMKADSSDANRAPPWGHIMRPGGGGAVGGIGTDMVGHMCESGSSQPPNHGPANRFIEEISRMGFGAV